MAFKFVLLSVLLAVASAGILQPVTYAHVANPAVDAVASSHQNVVRTFDGTVSQYSKSIEMPYSSVHKHDTRVSNNVYQPAVAKTVTYAAPAPGTVYTHTSPVSKTVTYAAPTQVYTHSAPVVHKTVYASPAQSTSYVHSSPVAKTIAYVAPAVSKSTALYTHAAPVSKTVYAPLHSHAVVAAPAVSKTVAYPAPAPVYQHDDVAKHVTYASSAPVYHHAAPLATTSYNHGPAATTYTHNAPGVSAYGASQTVHYSPADTSSHMRFDGFGTHWGW
ncbi:pupal cuticle protein C1B-like [Eurosta solidaginis]|uniref:pupal cuticle protein C1B-like n=1 Tax=Eurosta solidaginis TaxID=178769 RepID=UPI00353151B1